MYPLVQSILAFAVVCAVSALCVPARAQEEPPPEPAAVTPPRLVTRVPGEPLDELSSDRDVAVLLELTVDDAGRVSDVVVVESGGERFDQAAVDAAQRFKFEPARREGIPVTSGSGIDTSFPQDRLRRSQSQLRPPPRRQRPNRVQNSRQNRAPPSHATRNTARRRRSSRRREA